MAIDFTSVKFLKEQADLARRKRNDKQAIQALYALIEMYTEHFFYTEALQCMEELLGFLKKIKAKELFGDIYFRKGKILHLLGKSAEAQVEFQKALKFFKDYNDKNKEIETLIQLAILYSFQGKYTDSLQVLHQVLDYYTAEQDFRGRAYILGRIGHLYTEQEDYQQGLALNLESLAIYRTVDDKKGIWESLWGIGFIYLEQKDQANAAEIFAEMEAVSNELDLAYFKAGTLCGNGMILALDNRFEEAVSCEKQALVIARDLHAQRNEALILRFLGQIYIKMEKYNDAIEVLKDSLLIVEQQGFLRMQFLAHEQLAIAFEKTGNNEAAYYHFKKFVAIQNNVRGNIKQHELTQLRLRIEHTKNHYEKEILRLRAVHAEQEIQQKKKELSNLGADIARQHEMLEKIRQDVLHIVNLGEERRGTLQPARDLLQKVTSLLKNHNGIALFERQFDTVHQSFLKNLVDSYPSLTPTELKVCSLLRINLTTKEVAHLLCISVATVDLHRSHIRKKMNLSPDQNLTSFLASV